MIENVCEENVYSSIYLSESEKVRNFIFYKSGSFDLAEDVLQEAFIKLWLNCAKVEVKKARSYLYTVVNNLFVDQMRHKKIVLNFKNKSTSDVENKSPDFLIEEKEFKIQLENAINELPEDQRIIFLMNRLDKKKYAQIAEELGLSVKTIEKKMHLALMHLRKIHKKV